ncbi:MAG: FAD-dependent oxidoreductase [Candidatus Omnitrophota bacterium]
MTQNLKAMAKIIIIGNSPSGFNVCRALIKNPAGHEITVVSRESTPAYKRDLLFDFFSGKVAEKDLFLCNSDFYEKNKINLLKDKEVSRVDTKKQKVILKDNLKLDYDFLVIASGEEVSLPDIPGKNKEGVFCFYSLKDVKKIKQLIGISSVVGIIGEPGACQKIAEIVLAKKKEVKIISKPKPEAFFDLEHAEWIAKFDLAEIIGEGNELKALKLSNGKALGVDLVIVAGNYIPYSDFLKNSGIETDNGYIIVDSSMHTNIENIFACGRISKQGVVRDAHWPAETIVSAINGELICQKS